MGGSPWAGKLENAPVETRTDAEGHYRLEGLAAKSVMVTVRGEGDMIGVSEHAQVTEGGTARLDFTLEDLGTVEGVVRMAGGGALPAGPLFVNAISWDARLPVR